MLKTTCYFCHGKSNTHNFGHGCTGCTVCLKQLKQLENPETSYFLNNNNNGTSLRVCSLFLYQGLIRKLVLAAKLSNCFQAFHWIKFLLCHHPLWNQLHYLPTSQKNNHHLVMVSAPSSLYSRLRGRGDVAWFLADTLRKTSGGHLASPWSRHHFSLIKQTQLVKQARRSQVRILSDTDKFANGSLSLKPNYPHPRSRYFAEDTNLPQPSAPERTRFKVILVDDVLTTGHTILRMSQGLPDIKGLQHLKSLQGSRVSSDTKDVQVDGFTFCISRSVC